MTCAGDIMTPNPMTLAPTARLAEAIELLAGRRLSGAPVVDGGELVGIISELGVLDVLFDSSLRQAPVSDFMTRDVRTVNADDSLGHIAHMFALYGIRRLPVLENGRMVGIVSRRDLLAHALRTGDVAPDPCNRWVETTDEPLAGATEMCAFE